MENVASENQNEGAPPDVDPGLLLESFRDAKSQGTSVSEAITLVANAFGVSPEIVQLSVLGAVDSQGLGSDRTRWSGQHQPTEASNHLSHRRRCLPA